MRNPVAESPVEKRGSGWDWFSRISSTELNNGLSQKSRIQNKGDSKRLQEDRELQDSQPDMRNWHFKINLYNKPLATERDSLGLDKLLCLVLCGLIRSKGDFSKSPHPKISSSSLTPLCVVCGLRGWQVHASFRDSPVGMSCRMLLIHFHRIILWFLIFQTHPDRVVIQGAKQASTVPPRINCAHSRNHTKGEHWLNKEL